MDALDLVAKIKMDLAEYEEGLDKASNDAKKAGGGIGAAFGKVASTGGKALVGLTKVTAAAVGAAATGIGALVAKSVEAYSDYEQLVGGIETLFGTGGRSLEKYAEDMGQTVEEARGSYEFLEQAQNDVLQNASNAYKTAGMSANEYMETVTGFSASLIQAVGGDTVVAAKAADQAIVDMSDNANKMGTSMESIQNAYQGFAKQNYTMLDNLKLGYGGTKEEMQRLLNDAEELSGIHYELGNFYDMAEAIHVIQTEMGITGTTAREATETIQGSVGMMKSAWDNLVTGLGDKDADLNKLTQNLVDSIVGYTDEAGEHVKGVVDNIIPVIETALGAIGDVITKLVPQALKLIPTLLRDILPDLITAGLDLVNGLSESISNNLESIVSIIKEFAPKLITAFTSIIPQIITVAGEIIEALAGAIGDNAGEITSGVISVVQTFITTIVELLPTLLEVGLNLITALAQGIADAIPTLIPTIVEVALQIVQILIDNIPLLLDVAFQLINALAQGILTNIPTIIAAIPELIQSFVDGLVGYLPELTQAWITLMNTLEIALPEIIDALLAALPQIIDTIVNYWLGEGFQQTFKASVVMFGSLMKALTQIAASVVASIGMHVRQMASTIAGEAGTMIQAGIQFFGGLLSGITSKISEILGKIREFVSNVGTTIHSGFTSVLNGAKTWGSDMIKNFVSGITSKWNDLKGAVTNVANIIRNLLHFSEPDIGPLSDFHTYAPDMMDLFIKGINDNKQRLGNAVANAFDFKDSITSPELTATTQIKGNTQQTNESDIKKLLDNMNLTVNTYTMLDGEVINQKSYKYTIGQMGADTRAMKVATGGYV